MFYKLKQNNLWEKTGLTTSTGYPDARVIFSLEKKAGRQAQAQRQPEVCSRCEDVSSAEHTARGQPRPALAPDRLLPNTLLVLFSAWVSGVPEASRCQVKGRAKP